MSKRASERENSTAPVEISNGGKKFLIIAAIVVCLLAIGVWFFTQSSNAPEITEDSISNTATLTDSSANTTAPINANNQQASTTPSTVDEDKIEKLVLAGPMASVSNPLIKLKNSDALADVAESIEFREWRDPNQMRAMVLQGDVDFIAVPTNAAANLYNQGANIKLLDVSVWGILYIVSNDDQLTELTELKGKDLVMPFRGDMPDIVLQRILQEQGLQIGRDINLNYVANPIAAMQMLMTGKADYAVLVEPAVSMAMQKSRSLPASAVAPTLYRSIDLQQEWGNAFDTEPRLPQAGIAQVNPNLSQAQVDRFMDEYSNALEWTNAHPQEASVLIVKDFPMLNEIAVAQSIGNVNMTSVPASQAKPELEQFFEQLAKLNDKLIGGKLPDDNFYY